LDYYLSFILAGQAQTEIAVVMNLYPATITVLVFQVLAEFRVQVLERIVQEAATVQLKSHSTHKVSIHG
jgi:hypothetical protein